jgi:hypothetical protein
MEPFASGSVSISLTTQARRLAGELRPPASRSQGGRQRAELAGHTEGLAPVSPLCSVPSGEGSVFSHDSNGRAP